MLPKYAMSGYESIGVLVNGGKGGFVNSGFGNPRRFGRQSLCIAGIVEGTNLSSIHYLRAAIFYRKGLISIVWGSVIILGDLLGFPGDWHPIMRIVLSVKSGV